jgi:peroxiredoxin
LLNIKRVMLLWFFVPVLSWGQGLTDFEGRPHSLEEYTGRGSWTVVMIWAHGCPICNMEVQKFDMFHADHAGKDAMVVGISIDGGGNEKKAREFIDQHELEFPNLIADPATVAQLHHQLSGQRLRGTPTFLLFTPEGRLAGMQVGPLEPEAIEAFMRSRVVGAEAS